MCEDRRRSPGQWAPWISDPDPPEPPMTDEQMTAAAKATKDLVPQGPEPSSSSQPAQTSEERRAELLADVLRNHPNLTPEEANEMLDLFS